MGATFPFTHKEMMTSKRTKSYKDNHLRNEFQKLMFKDCLIVH